MPPHDPNHENEKIDRLRRAMYSRSISPNIKDKERRELGQERETVGEDWVRPEPGLEPSMVAPRGMNLVRAGLWWFLIAAIIFFVGAIIFFIYFFTFGGGSSAVSPSNIDIVVSGPPQISGGSATELQISVTNRNNAVLELADLIVTYPDGTRSATDNATALPSLRQSLGTIAPGATRQGTVTAVFAGKQGAPADVKVELEYHLSGSNAIFDASTDYAFTFSSSPLSVAVAGNTQTISGQPVELTATVSSNSNAPIKDVLLHADYPFGFKFTSSTPAPSSDGLWQLGELDPGKQKTVILDGILTGEQNDSRVFNFTTGTRTNATSTAIDVPLSNDSFPIAISQTFLGLSLAVNGSDSPTAIVAPGDKVIITISYQNNLQTAITDAVVVAKLSGLMVDGTTVSASNGFYRSTDNTVLWNKSTTNGALATLAPGATGTLTFGFIVPSNDALKGVSNPSIAISINAAGNRVSEAGVPENLQSTTQKRIAVTSNLQLTANGLYYASPYGSIGPLPPKSGSETNYAIVFTITNTTNKIASGVVTATLPAYVRSTGKCSPASECASSNQLKFNQDTGTVTWNVGDVAPGVGLNGVEPRQVAFEVGFTASDSQIGQSPPLIQNIQFTGTDAATGQAVTRSVPDVTTNLIGDTGFNSTNAEVVR